MNDKKAETYQKMKARQQQEVNAFPIHAAFGQDQINRKCAKLGLSADESAGNYYGKHIVSLGFGTFVLKTDFPAYKEMVHRHVEEKAAAIKADADGSGFIKDMFVDELWNHEYGYTMDPSDTLTALGLTMSQVANDPKLKTAFEMACTQVIREGA